MIRLKPMRGYGMVAADAAVFQVGSEPMYRDLLTCDSCVSDAVTVFQRFARARGLYPDTPNTKIDGSWGAWTELAWMTVMPGAVGPTTTRMLEGLDALSAAAFRPLATRYGIAIARDRYLARQGIYQREPDQNAHVDRMNLMEGSPAWNPAEASVGQALVEWETDTPAVQEPGEDDPVPPTDTDVASSGAGTAVVVGAGKETPSGAGESWWGRYKWWVVGGLALAGAGTVGGVYYYRWRKRHQALQGIVLRGIVLR